MLALTNLIHTSTSPYTMINKTSLLIVCALIAYSLPLHAEDREWVPYKKLVELTYLDKFYQTEPAQRNHLRLLIQVIPENKSISASTIVLTLRHPTGTEKLPLNADGTMEIVPNPEWMKDGAIIYTNLPKSEKSAITAFFASKTPESLQLNYGELMSSVTQWNALIKDQAGLLRFMLPKFNAIHLHFSKPWQQSLKINTKDGGKTFLADSKGIITLKLDQALLSANPTIVLSEMPTLVDVDEV